MAAWSPMGTYILLIPLCPPSYDLWILNHKSKLPFSQSSSLQAESSGPSQAALNCLLTHSNIHSPATSPLTFIRPIDPKTYRLASLSTPIFTDHRVLWANTSCPKQATISFESPFLPHLSTYIFQPWDSWTIHVCLTSPTHITQLKDKKMIKD